MTRKVELAHMSWKDVEPIDRAHSVLLLPVGVLEQHGPAGPMGTDYIMAERVAVQSAGQLDDVYVAPTIAYGYSPTFQGFPGNLGIPFEVFKLHLSAVVERLIACGWRNIIFVDNHGGNEAACEQVGREMRAKYGIVMAHLYPWRIAMHFCRDLYEDVKAAYGHGAEPTMSVMMALFPEHTDQARMVADKFITLPGFEASSPAKVTFQGFEVGLYLETDTFSKTGASADPAEASREKGEDALRRIIDYCVAFIPRYHTLVNEHFDAEGRFHA